MNYAFMVTDSMSPSTQKNDCCCKDSAAADIFSSMLSGFMGADTTSFSVSHTEISGRAKYGEEMILHECEGLEEISSRVQYLMDLMFVRNGIPKDPPVEVEYSYTRTEIIIKGEREDADKVSQLVNSNGELKNLIKDMQDMIFELFGGGNEDPAVEKVDSKPDRNAPDSYSRPIFVYGEITTFIYKEAEKASERV